MVESAAANAAISIVWCHSHESEHHEFPTNRHELRSAHSQLAELQPLLEEYCAAPRGFMTRAG